MIREGVMTSTFAVIGVVRKDRSGAVKLFGQHGARQQMRPCRRAERQQQVGLGATVFLMAVSRADEETRLGHAPVPPDRTSAVQGKSGSVRGDLGGRRLVKKKK